MSEWNDVRIETLKRLWSLGWTASQIATELGGVTRNGVMGKAHRLGLVGRPSPIKGDPETVAANRKEAWRARRNGIRTKQPRHREGQRAVAEARERTAQAAVQPATAVNVKPVTKPTGISAERLSVHSCAWPIGDPKAPDFHFCGAKPVVPGKPYCLEHCRRAYRAPEEVAKERAEREAA